MSKKLKILLAVLISLPVLFCLLIVYIWLFVINQETNLVKKNLVEQVYIEQANLIIQVKEDHAGTLSIDYNNQTIYNKDLGRKISKLEIENYASFLEDKKVYRFMFYRYSLGGHQLSGFDFCINQQKVYYGKDLDKCQSH